MWKTGPRVLFAGDMRIRRDRRLSLVKNHLVISGVEPGDAGEFSCETETLGGDVHMMVMHLDILSPPSVHILGGDGAVTVKFGASLVLTCIGRGMPLPKVSWWNKGLLAVTSVGMASFEVPSASLEDAGNITCTADNGVGTVAEETIYLHVLGEFLERIR